MHWNLQPALQGEGGKVNGGFLQWQVGVVRSTPISPTRCRPTKKNVWIGRLPELPRQNVKIYDKVFLVLSSAAGPEQTYALAGMNYTLRAIWRRLCHVRWRRADQGLCV